MLGELIKAFALIFIAEMGDKTQILVMAFATKYHVKKVLIGIFIGSLLNHGIAVFLGNTLFKMVDPNLLQIVAGFAFILFAIWNLKMADEEEQVDKKNKYGPIVTVAIALFIGELGDKTQLTAITLAASSQYPLFILMGTVSGMVVTGAVGIYFGIKLGSKIPELFIKISAAVIFYLFGFVKLYKSLPSEYLKLYYVIPFILIAILIGWVILAPSLKNYHEGKVTLYKKTAEKLSNFYNVMAIKLEDICLGEEVCGVCEGSKCLIGYTKDVINKAKKGKKINLAYIENLDNQKNFNKALVLGSLKLTVNILKDYPKTIKLLELHQIRKIFEMILFNEYIKEFKSYETYYVELTELNQGKYNL